MNTVPSTVLLLILAGSTASCGDCASTGPSGPGVQFAGTLAGGSATFHDIVVPSNTDSVDLVAQWMPAEAQLAVTQISSDCDPTQRPDCPRVTETLRAAPGGPQNTLSGYLSHQGTSATGRVRVLLQNLTPDVSASYSATAIPQRHGCDR